MCTMITHQAKIEGRGKSGKDWFEVREANVSYDHPYDLPLEHALNIDFVDESKGPAARVAVELSVDAARQLVKTIEAVLAQAEHQGVLEVPRHRRRDWRACSKTCRRRLPVSQANPRRVILFEITRLTLTLRNSFSLTV